MAHEFLNFILALSIIIAAAKLGGYLSVRLRQPSVLGELLVGLILGPTVLDMLHAWPMFAESGEILSESISFMAELGVILLMFLAGLELHLSELLRSGKAAAFAGVLGVILPMALGFGTAYLFDIPVDQAVFLGLTLSATSVSISAQTLMELGELRSRVGLGLLGAAVFDDIMVILLLSIGFILFGSAGGGVGSILLTILAMIAYIVIASALGFWLLPRLVNVVDRLPISQGTIAFVLVTCLLFAWAAEVLGGMAAITGAFLVGLFLARSSAKEQIEAGVSALAYGFFVPIFFVNIGLEVNMRAISGDVIWLTVIVVVIAIVSKLLGSGLGARLAGYGNLESLQLGIGMVSRGEVGLIVASFARSEGLLEPELFSVAVVMVIIATLVTPPMLRISFSGREETQTSAASIS